MDAISIIIILLTIVQAVGLVSILPKRGKGMRFCLFIFLSLFSALLIGCSGGGSPVMPATGDDGGIYIDDKSTASTEARTPWGMFEIGIDPATKQFDLTPSHQSSSHYNTSNLVSGDILKGNITLKFAGLDAESSIIKFDLALKNPSANICGYDVRAIIAADDEEYYLVNADGATALQDDIGNVSLNTFLAFAEDQPRRAFGPGESYTERGELHFPPNPEFRKLKLIIDASYPSNCMEPYGFSDFSYSNNSVAIGVLDWQENVNSVEIVITAIGATEDIYLELDPFNNLWNGELGILPGTGLMVIDAAFRGELVSDSDPRNGIRGLQDAEGYGIRGLYGFSNPSGDLIACPVKATSDGMALWGHVILQVIDAPGEIIKDDSGKLSYELMDLVSNPLTRNDYVRVIAYVANSPVGYLVRAKESADAAYPEIAEISGQIHALYRSAQPELSEFANENYYAFVNGDQWAVSRFKSILAEHGADRSSIEWMVLRLERLREQRAEYARHEIEAEIAPLQDYAVSQVAGVAETEYISGDYLLNCIFIVAKVSRLPELAELDSIEYIQQSFVGVPQLNHSTPGINANDMWGAGYTGGAIDVQITDTGIDDSHPALVGKLTAETQKAFSGCDIDDDTGHGTHLAGIVTSGDVNLRGVAYSLDKLYNGKICSPYYWDWFVDSFEWGGMGGTVSDKAEIINFSWAMGPNTNCVRDGNYPTSRYFDAYTYVYGQFFACSAGNQGNGVCEDDDNITMPSDAFNVMAVANMDDNNSTYRTDDAISSGSRIGPGTTSNGEYRVKPDIAAPGTKIKSCYYKWETHQNFAEMSGTSMSAPHIAGAAALVMDAGLVSSLEARVILMVTADDWNGSSSGPGTDGPDNYTGFGYVNLNNVLLNLGNINTGTVQQGDIVLFRHTGQSANDHVLALWDRHCTQYANWYPDMDLYVYNDVTGGLIDSENKLRDNKRYLASGTTSDVIYKLKVQSLPTTISSYWDYALAATGGTLSAPLDEGNFDPDLVYPEPIEVGVEFDIEATVTNDGDLKLRDVEATLDLDTNMTFENGSTATQAGPTLLNPGEDHVFTWHVKLSSYSSTPKHIEVDTQASAYGMTFTGTTSADITVQEPPPLLDVDPLELDFGTLVDVDTFNVDNIGGETLTWSIDDSGFPGWLSIDNTGDTTQEETDIVEVTVDRDGFPPGPYDHDIQVTSDAGNETVHVIMVVPDPQLNVDPLNLDFGETFIELEITVSNDNNGNLDWLIDNDPPKEYPEWLQTNIDSGVVLETEESDSITVTVSRADLVSSVYTHDLEFTSNGGDEVVHVSMTVPDPILYVDPLSLDFGGYDTQDQFSIENHGMGIMAWRFDMSGFPDWLSVDDNDGNTKTETDTVAVYVDRDGIDPGEYSHDIEVTSNGGNDTVHVSMMVYNTILDIQPESLDFGETAIKKTLTVSNAGEGEMNWQIAVAPPHEFPEWLSTDMQIGKITDANPEDEIDVFCDRTGYTSGDYHYDMYFTSDGGEMVIPIDMTVPAVNPLLEVNLHNLDFGETIDQLQIIITNIGDAGSMLDWNISLAGMPEWMNPDKYSGHVDTSDLEIVKIDVDRAGLEPGDYEYDMAIESNGGNDSVHIEITAPNLAPPLTGPADGYHYEVWSPLEFSWFGNPGYDGKYYIEVKYNGAPYPPFSNIPIVQNHLTLPAFMVDKLAKYGTWEWAIYIYAYPDVKHYSEWRTIYKDRPELSTPPNMSTVDASTEFTWSKVVSADSTNTWYIAKVTGFPGLDPMYFWWKNTDTAPLPPAWLAILKNAGVDSMTWTIAATSGDPATTGGIGMTKAFAKTVKYPSAWTFYVE